MNRAFGGILLTAIVLVAVAPNAAADCSFDYDEQYVGDYRIEVMSGGCDNSWSNGSSAHSHFFFVVHTPDGERLEFHAENGKYQNAYNYGSYSGYDYNYHHGVGVMSNVGPQTVRADGMTYSNGWGSSDSNYGWAWCSSYGQLHVAAYPVATTQQPMPGTVCTPLFNLGGAPVLPYAALGDLF